MTYEFSKYKTNIQNVNKTLDKYGVAIIDKVLDEKFCDKGFNDIWNYFEHISKNWELPIDKDKENTWSQFSKLYPTRSMLYQHWNIGHSQVCWDTRQNPNIVNVFSKIWNVENNQLLTSFDGLSFSVPHEKTKKGYFRNNLWHHSDQSFTRHGKECVQGWVTFCDVNEGDATLSVFEGSHKYTKEFQDTFNVKDKKDWYKLNKEENQFYKDKDCEEVRIKCPKGSLVLWDSRTIHCGVQALKNRNKPNYRAIVYVCYTPRALATKAKLKKKQKAFNELRMTTHWPHNPKLFPKFPRTYGGEIPNINKIQSPELTELGKKLAGF